MQGIEVFKLVTTKGPYQSEVALLPVLTKNVKDIHCKLFILSHLITLYTISVFTTNFNFFNHVQHLILLLCFNKH